MEEKESQLAEITRSLLEDYEKGRDIDRLDGACYPTRTEMAALIRQLRGILLPGFRGETAADTIRETLLRLQGQMDAVMGADADTMDKATDRLIKYANDGGGLDNITVILITL